MDGDLYTLGKVLRNEMGGRSKTMFIFPSVLVPSFFVRVGEMHVKGPSNSLGHFQVKNIVNLVGFYFISFELK